MAIPRKDAFAGEVGLGGGHHAPGAAPLPRFYVPRTILAGMSPLPAHTRLPASLAACALLIGLAPRRAGAQTLGQDALVPQLVGAYVSAPVPRPTPADFPPQDFASAETELRNGSSVLDVSEAVSSSDGDSLLVDGFDRGYFGEQLIAQIDYDFGGAAATPRNGAVGYRYAFTTTAPGNAFRSAIDGVRVFEGGRLAEATAPIGGVASTFDFEYEAERLVGWRLLDEAGRPTAASATFVYYADGRLRESTITGEEGDVIETHTYTGGLLESTTSSGPSDADDYVITYAYTDGVATGASVTGRARTSTIRRTDDGSDVLLVILEEEVEGTGTYRTVYNLRDGVLIGLREAPASPVTVAGPNPAVVGNAVEVRAPEGLAVTTDLLDATGRVLRRWTGDQRTLRLPAVPAGAYVLLIRTAGYGPLSHRVVVR